ncbi:unnamed protein product, partial [Symbiodinium sp. CCMP2456]
GVKIEPWLGGPLKTEPFSNIVEAVLRTLALPKSSATVDLDKSDLQQVTVNANSSPGFPLRYQGFTKLRAACEDGALANQVKSLLEVISNAELADLPDLKYEGVPWMSLYMKRKLELRKVADSKKKARTYFEAPAEVSLMLGAWVRKFEARIPRASVYMASHKCNNVEDGAGVKFRSWGLGLNFLSGGAQAIHNLKLDMLWATNAGLQCLVVGDTLLLAGHSVKEGRRVLLAPDEKAWSHPPPCRDRLWKAPRLSTTWKRMMGWWMEHGKGLMVNMMGLALVRDPLLSRCHA